ncbi:hypothetical protein HAX54_028594, partial [Datura stramonium]|nr:hypothetical protein [Datura stramonium]
MASWFLRSRSTLNHGFIRKLPLPLPFSGESTAVLLPRRRFGLMEAAGQKLLDPCTCEEDYRDQNQ